MSDSVHIVCPNCDATNRIPADRLTNRPKCGRCKAPVFTGRPVVLTSGNFQAHIANTDVPVVVDFWVPWCGPCRMMAPAFEQAAAQLEPHVRLAKLDTEAEPAIGAQFAIRSIPTLVVFRNGREVVRQPGAIPNIAQLVSWIGSKTRTS